MKLTLEIEETDLKVLTQGIQDFTDLITVAAQKKRLQKIVDYLSTYVDLEKKIFEKVKAFLEPKTNVTIQLNSDLRNDLSISGTWLKNSLFNACNDVLTELLNESNPPKTTTPIKKAAAAACITVKDIVNLIKKTYESAQ